MGYARAVRLGPHLYISGTTATNAQGQIVHPGDAAAQAAHIFEMLARVLAEAGGTLQNVGRTRIYLTEAADWEAVGRAHAAAFGDVRPACTMVVVAALLDPALRVEIEADAYLG